MAIRDLYDRQTPALWGGSGTPAPSVKGSTQEGGVRAQDQKFLIQCKPFQFNRNILLAFSGAFVVASAMMAKAFHDRYPAIPDHHKDMYRSAARLIAIAPIGIATLFFKWAYQQGAIYNQCLQDPRGTLARIADSERAESESTKTKRVSINIPDGVAAASWLAGAAVIAEGVAYYGVAAAEGVFASGFSLCATGMRYFNPRDDANSIL